MRLAPVNIVECFFGFIFTKPLGSLVIDLDTNTPHFEHWVLDVLHCRHLGQADLGIEVGLEVESH